MKIYRVHMLHEGGISAGYSFHSSRREAEKAAREHIASLCDDVEPEQCEIEVIDVTTTKAGIISALNKYADHADNG